MNYGIIAQVAHANRTAKKLGKPAKINAAGQVWILKNNPKATWYEAAKSGEQVTVKGTMTLAVSWNRSRDSMRPVCAEIANALGWSKHRVIGGNE